MKKMKKAMLALLTICMCGGIFFAVSSNAEAKTTVKIVQKSETLKNDAGKTIGIFKYQLPQLTGKSAAVKKINKALKKNYKTFYKNYHYVVEKSAVDENRGDTLFVAKAPMKVTYKKNNVISFRQKVYAYGGGAHPAEDDTYGYTFSLKTGKKLTIANVTKGSAKTVKKQIAKKIAAKYADDVKDMEIDLNKAVMDVKTKDINYYIKGGKAYIVFPHYTLGAWALGVMTTKVPCTF